MKRAVLVIVILFLMNGVVAFSEPATSDLRVIIEKIRTNNGTVNVALCSSSEQYHSDENLFRAVRIDPVKPVTEYVFKNIPYGEYALKVYHDENSNDKLDKGFLGIPKERYGFSNNPKIKGKMPPFEETVFEVKSSDETRNIKMR